MINYVIIKNLCIQTLQFNEILKGERVRCQLFNFKIFYKKGIGPINKTNNEVWLFKENSFRY